ncbi:MAG: HAMP domain-containing sensor histidine kinase [Lachnospiraceae bacterium]|nr:HAMP domain-containing sensor histidine kinase [Lachnospiraceae bacterium]
MKRLSIKLRITLWFTIFMMLLVIVVSVFLVFSGRQLKSVSMQKQLMKIVDKIEDSDRNQIAKKITEPIDNVYISIYDTNKNLLGGILPDGFEQTTDFKDEMPYVIHSGDKIWYIYDIKCKKEHGHFLWVRGVLRVDNVVDSTDLFLRLLVCILPFMVITIALMGYIIIRRAFRPINEIIKAADKIGEGADLSQRIHLGEGKDELYTLANTFDHMFEKLETYFENEKRFTADASHELRTPTSVIIAQCDYALENAVTVDESKEALLKIKQQALKMSSLIANLLMLARIDNGQYNKWNLELINLSELIEVIIEQQNEFAEKKGIVITKEMEPDIYIRAEETMIMRVLINLIENGIQYGKQNGLINILLVKKEKLVELKIIDNGIGIAPKHLNQIWERFYQVDPSRNNVRNNTGLGLAMVKWIVKAHNGNITVQSELGKGSIFTVTIPCYEK